MEFFIALQTTAWTKQSFSLDFQTKLLILLLDISITGPGSYLDFITIAHCTKKL